MGLLKTIDIRNKWDSTFMEIASLFAGHSSCIKRKVGAILVKDLRILSTGYNGTPVNFINCDEYFMNGGELSHHDFHECYEIHAEQNCLAFAAKNGVSTKDCILYVTTAPCVNCAKLIIASGIKEVIYRDVYKNDNGIKLLSIAGIKCRQIS